MSIVIKYTEEDVKRLFPEWDDKKCRDFIEDCDEFIREALCDAGDLAIKNLGRCNWR